MPTVIVRERLPYHPRLGRNVNHDSRSRGFRVTAPPDTPIVDVQHERHIPVLDQARLGACTGNAGVGCTGTGLFYATLGGRITDIGANPGLAVVANLDVPIGTSPRYGWDEPGAVALYSRATELDPYQGSYPPDDTGSDGLSIAKALKEAVDISGYLWAFTPTEARAALMSTPVITGIPWYASMFDPTSDGQLVVDRTSGLAGGHEIVVDGYRVAGDQVWITNSWGPGWGAGGRAWLSFADWSWLLSQDGDVTQFVPVTDPAPDPDPSGGDAAGDELWGAARHWATAHHGGENKMVARAVLSWAKRTGRA